MPYEGMELFFLLSSEYIQKTLLMRNGPVADTKSTSTLILNFPISGLYEMNFYFLPISRSLTFSYSNMNGLRYLLFHRCFNNCLHSTGA